MMKSKLIASALYGSDVDDSFCPSKCHAINYFDQRLMIDGIYKVKTLMS